MTGGFSQPIAGCDRWIIFSTNLRMPRVSSQPILGCHYVDILFNQSSDATCIIFSTDLRMPLRGAFQPIAGCRVFSTNLSMLRVSSQTIAGCRMHLYLFLCGTSL
eukprot:2029090-Pyramimonas_sp.AAC.1